MPLLPTGKIEEKHPESKHELLDSNDFYMKLPRLLPPKDFEETNSEYDRFQKIKFIILIVVFSIFLVFLHLNRTGI
ncbi:MAG: hypothetical protein KO464_11340 [Candidatus Methanofastidiosum sp.]|nr:hypothetical protein [Methanofastidiosum sp.]